MLPLSVIRVADAIARAHNLPSDRFDAIIDIESGGKIFATVNGKQMPLILFEPGIFFRKISDDVQKEAVAKKLASPSQNSKLYPKTQAARWEQMRSAAQLLADHGLPPDAAFESASYGAGQVLGQNWKDLGFESVSAFMEQMCTGAEGQLEIMAKFIEINHLDDDLRDGRMETFFRGYNGKDWKKLDYGKKFDKVYPLYSSKAHVPPAKDGMLRMGSTGAKVRELQRLLIRAGYQVRDDGDFGPSTRDALKAFQKASGITVDGVYGPETEGALTKFRQPGENLGKQPATDVGKVKEGVGGMAIGATIEVAQDKIDTATSALQNVNGFDPWLGYGLTALAVIGGILAVAGAIWAVHGWLESRKTKEV